MDKGFKELEYIDPTYLAPLDGLWAYGDTGSNEPPPFLFFLLEMFFAQLGERYELSCAKSMPFIDDPESQVWHNDGDNPADPDTKLTILVYRSTGEPLQIKCGEELIELNPYPGRVVVLDNTQLDILHRCKPSLDPRGAAPRSFIKVTLK